MNNQKSNNGKSMPTEKRNTDGKTFQSNQQPPICNNSIQETPTNSPNIPQQVSNFVNNMSALKGCLFSKLYA